MFYLINYFKSIVSFPFLWGCHFFISLVFLVGIVRVDWIEGKLFQSLKRGDDNSFFHALISGRENGDWIVRKMRDLPGVESVTLMSKKMIEQQVAKIIKGLQVNVADEIVEMNYIGLKIVFTDDILVRSRDLIREYLVRLVGKQNVTLGAVVLPEKTDSDASVIKIKKWGIPLVFAVIGLIWLITHLLLVRNLAKMAYLIEQYQRRKMVALKLLFSATTFTLIVALIVNMILGDISIVFLCISSVLYLFTSLTGLHRYRWDVL